MRKTILEMEYFYKKYDLSNVKNFQKNSFIFSRDGLKTFILLWRDKKYRFINI